MEENLLEGRHPGTVHLFSQFRADHLPKHLQEVSHPCGALAFAMIKALPDGPELTVGLRKLLEAKDCFVRHAVNVESSQGLHEGTAE